MRTDRLEQGVCGARHVAADALVAARPLRMMAVPAAVAGVADRAGGVVLSEMVELIVAGAAVHAVAGGAAELSIAMSVAKARRLGEAVPFTPADADGAVRIEQAVEAGAQLGIGERP